MNRNLSGLRGARIEMIWALKTDTCWISVSVHHVCQSKCLGPCYFKCRLGTSSMDLICDLDRSATLPIWICILTRPPGDSLPIRVWGTRVQVTGYLQSSLFSSSAHPNAIIPDEGVGRAMWQAWTRPGLVGGRGQARHVVYSAQDSWTFL